MALSEDAVREALKQVVDPELFVNIVDLGLVYTVMIETASAADPTEPPADATASSTDSAVAAGSPTSESVPPASGDQGDSEPAASPNESGEPLRVVVEMTMTSPACPAGPQLVAQTKTAVGQLEGVRDVEVKIVMTPPWTPDRMTEDARDQLGIF